MHRLVFFVSPDAGLLARTRSTQAQGVERFLLRRGEAGGVEGMRSAKRCNEQLQGVAALLSTGEC